MVREGAYLVTSICINATFVMALWGGAVLCRPNIGGSCGTVALLVAGATVLAYLAGEEAMLVLSGLCGLAATASLPLWLIGLPLRWVRKRRVKQAAAQPCNSDEQA
jgi:hypothetical protein